MHKNQIGILLYRKLIKENDLFVKILLDNNSIVTGIVYGGSSSKKKNIYQIGYYLNLRLNKKNSNSPYIIEAEISYPLVGSIINDKFKLYCILSIVSLINISIVEGQIVKGLFENTDKFINNLITKKNWIILYCKWLFDLLKVIGYEIDYKSNLKNSFFDIELIIFTNIKNHNTYEFPHQFLANKTRIQSKYLEIIFTIFEKVFKSNHLNNINYKLPYSYINFKKLIINYLIKNHG
tara:strand:- start:576 stop:1283 length:708 start_codon:yes stop_codon:yes gene_type:complete